MTFLEVKNLSVRFPDLVAVDKISFAAEEGKKKGRLKKTAANIYLAIFTR